MPGWGTAVGWIFDRLPNKRESIRNKMENIKREMDEITKKVATDKSTRRYERLADKLRKLNQRSKNI